MVYLINLFDSLTLQLNTIMPDLIIVYFISSLYGSGI